MKHTEPFQMKQFSVAHDKCAMRVNTDGCLLGAIAGKNFDAAKLNAALDVGTGSGVIALQLAQRFEKAYVDAVDIHGPSARQATDNFKNSPFNGRMICYHEPIQDFELNLHYDLIVSNPPYFEDGPTKADQGIASARHALTLDFKSLIEKSAKLLKEDGEFWCILPVDRMKIFLEEAIDEGLFPYSLIYIKPKDNRTANRIIIGLGKDSTKEPVKEDIVLYTDENRYTPTALSLLSPFYASL